MKTSFFHQAKKVAGVGALSYFGIHYIKCFIHAYESRVKHAERLQQREKEGLPPLATSTIWGRFCSTYLANLPLANHKEKAKINMEKEIEDQASDLSQSETRPR